MERKGQARQGRLGWAWHGLVRTGRLGAARFVAVWFSLAWQVRLGRARKGRAGHGQARKGRHGTARTGLVWRGYAGEARIGVARSG
jgi:hypothetical protein